MDFEEPQQPQQPEAPEAPAAPAPDPVELAAQRYGLTPEQLDGAARLYEENRRVYEENQQRRREIDRERIEIEALKREREQYAAPQRDYYENTDPALRPVLDRFEKFEKRWEEREIRQEDAERARQAAVQTAQELDRNYKAVMRGVPSQNQVTQDRFFEALGELYPTETGELPRGISPERAVFATARYLGLNVNGAKSNGYAPQPQVLNPGTPRAQVIIPGGSTGSASSPADMDRGPRRPNESLEQYIDRLERAAKTMGVVGIRDGTRVSSE